MGPVPATKKTVRRALWLLAVAVLGNLTTAAGPVQAQGSINFGGGTLVGTASFSGNGVPPVNTPCQPISFSLQLKAALTLANASGQEFVGTVPEDPTSGFLGGSGSSNCENTTVGGGTLAINGFSVTQATGGTLTCTGFSGTYVRTATDLSAVLGSGPLSTDGCKITGSPTGKVAIIVRAEVVPTPGTGNGVSTGVTAATFSGTFTVVPAEGQPSTPAI